MLNFKSKSYSRSSFKIFGKSADFLNSKFLTLLIFSSRVGKGKGEGEGEVEETRCRVAEILKTFAKKTEKESMKNILENMRNFLFS